VITIETGTYRFFTGDNVAYHDATTSWLIEQASSAEDLALRSYAAAGLMRALLDTPVSDRNNSTFNDSIDWVREVILDVQAGIADVTQAQPAVKAFVDEQPPVNGIFDATSMAATKANRPNITAAIINRYIPAAEAKVVIGLGHGGILSSLATFAALPGDKVFYPVRFSKYKAMDNKPVLAAAEKNFLEGLVQNRAVIVHDEDRGLWSGSTIREAVHYINRLFGVSAFGITPVLARHPTSMWPQVIRKIPGKDEFSADTYDPWSDDFKAILNEQANLNQTTA
jgi:hypothetical protein